MDHLVFEVDLALKRFMRVDQQLKHSILVSEGNELIETFEFDDPVHLGDGFQDQAYEILFYERNVLLEAHKFFEIEVRHRQQVLLFFQQLIHLSHDGRDKLDRIDFTEDFDELLPGRNFGPLLEKWHALPLNLLVVGNDQDRKNEVVELVAHLCLLFRYLLLVLHWALLEGQIVIVVREGLIKAIARFCEELLQEIIVLEEVGLAKYTSS